MSDHHRPPGALGAGTYAVNSFATPPLVQHEPVTFKNQPTDEYARHARDMMERERSNQKRQRLRRAMRPEGEGEKGEFLEMWTALKKRKGQDGDKLKQEGDDSHGDPWSAYHPVWRPELLPPSDTSGDSAPGLPSTCQCPFQSLRSNLALSGGAGGRQTSCRKRKERDLKKPLTVWVWDFEALVGDRALWAAPQGEQIGGTVRDATFDLSDRYMFYEQIENWRERFNRDITFIDQYKAYDDARNLAQHDFSKDYLAVHDFKEETPDALGHLALRFSKIQEMFDEGLEKLVSKEELNKLDDIVRQVNDHSRRGEQSEKSWLELGQASLEKIREKQGVLVLVSSAPLVPLLAKCLILRYNRYFEAINIFSASTKSRYHCCKCIIRYFGKDAHYRMVHDGVFDDGDDRKSWEEVATLESKLADFKMIPISNSQDIIRLTRDLDEELA